MDLSKFSEEELLLTAMKSEVDSREFYSELARRVRNFLLKEKLSFLSGEEEKHRAYFDHMYTDRYPDRRIVMPKKTPVPLPQLEIASEDVQLSELFTRAMEAEMAAHGFYTDLADRVTEEQVKKTVLYIAAMEMGHYKLLEVERENAEKYEDFDVEWPLTHVGP